MGILKRIVGNLIFLICIILNILYIVNITLHKETVNFMYISDQMFLLPISSENPNYLQISRNVYKCDLVTVSNIVANMIKEGYVIKQYLQEEDCLDVILQKGKDKYRLYYNKQRILTSIAYIYENSYIPFTYIIEEN